MAISIIRQLDRGWAFSEIGGGQGTKDGEWLSIDEIPTTVHVELLKAKRIPDPFVGLDEWEVQWIGEKEWSFKTEFTVTDAELQATHADLVFDGLDTFATVLLNGKEILQSENQFIAHRVPVKDTLKIGENTLVVNFASAFVKGRELEQEHGKLSLWNGDSSRLHVRKAGYNYGWDWGPVLMTVGPWRPISLHTYQNRISDLYIKNTVSEELTIDVDVHLTLFEPRPAVASVMLKSSDGVTVVGSDNIPIVDGQAVASFKLSKGTVNLWYPVGYGEQPLYTVEIEVAHEQEVVDRKSQRIAFRRARIVEDKLIDHPGLSWLFEINNIRIFCGGSNWIPADSFLTTVTSDRYRAWLKLLVDGNQNMVRVWGGGIYEPDIFYDICDELGILCWQDFMFGCGQYPAYDSFVKSVKTEAEQHVKRLRHHPSLVIFAGNNEDYQLAEALNLQLDYADEISDFRKTNFPARYIYERVLPSIVEANCDIYYHRSSPYSGHGKPTTDLTYGDIHQWNVWHGTQEPWSKWDVLAGRFVSEFGMQGYPDIRTVDYWTGDHKTERYPQSRTSVNHNKADGFERRLELYLMENFKHAFTMESYVYYTQIMQAEALASAYRLWRRNWKGNGRELTSGALVWQLNDCWPVTSWAIVDYFLRPKPAYFAIARELQTYTVGLTRTVSKKFTNPKTAAFFTIDTTLEIWGTNKTLEDKAVTLDITCFDLENDRWTYKWEQGAVLAANASTEIFKGPLPGQPRRTKESQAPKSIIASARLLDQSTGTLLARATNWPEPYKYLKFPPLKEVELTVTLLGDGESVQLSSSRPVKGIVLDAEGECVKWGDQAIDLVPGDPQIVKAIGLKGREVKTRFLGDGSA